jgi:hypothetical protein
VGRNLDVTESGEWAEIWMLLIVVSGQKFGCY